MRRNPADWQLTALVVLMAAFVAIVFAAGCPAYGADVPDPPPLAVAAEVPDPPPVARPQHTATHRVTKALPAGQYDPHADRIWVLEGDVWAEGRWVDVPWVAITDPETAFRVEGKRVTRKAAFDWVTATLATSEVHAYVRNRLKSYGIAELVELTRVPPPPPPQPAPVSVVPLTYTVPPAACVGGT